MREVALNGAGTADGTIAYRDILACVLITFVGALLRVHHYDTSPYLHWTLDEYSYVWSGMSLLRDHVPTGWSWLPAYGDVPISEWQGESYRLVTPWFDHPPLFGLLVGASALASGAVHYFDCTLGMIRIPSLVLGIASIVLLYMLSIRIAGTLAAVIASLIYACNPNTVFLSRTALSENLIVFLSLLVMLLYVKYSETLKTKYLYIAAFLAGAASLAKVPGLYLVVCLCTLTFLHARWREFLTVAFIGGALFALYPIYGMIYDFELFLRIIKEQGGRFGFIGLQRITRMFYNNHHHPLDFDPVFLVSWLIFLVYAWRSRIFIPSFNSIVRRAVANTPVPVDEGAMAARSRLSAEVIVTPVLAYAGILFVSGGISHMHPWYGIPFYPFIFLAVGVFCEDRITAYRQARKPLVPAQQSR